MKDSFIEHKFRGDSQRLIDISIAILDDMEEQEYTLTLRQLYYQLVAKDIIPNSEKSYKSLGKLITRAREAGQISWTAIEDRGRTSHRQYFQENLRTIFRGLDGCITYDRWARQQHYVEVWIEKDALVGVIEKPCDDLFVPYMACKGYLSASEAWRAGQRFEKAIDNGKHPVLIHLGDHDPSGIDMTRDNRVRLELFSRNDISVERIALNQDQIRKYKPPPNPAKLDDPRAHDYIKAHGNVSWELDALTPKIIDQLIRDKIEMYIDRDLWDEVEADEESVRERIRLLPQLHDKIFKLVDKHMEKE
jgi:hypothetical protein